MSYFRNHGQGAGNVNSRHIVQKNVGVLKVKSKKAVYAALRALKEIDMLKGKK